MLIMALDFGQLEARVVAMCSKDPVYIKALWEGEDTHGEWTERIVAAYPSWIKEPIHEFKSDKKVFKWYRDIVKNKWTFALFFGSVLDSVAADLKIPVSILKPVYELWWKTFTYTKEWQEQLVKDFERDGYVSCLTGRRRRAPLRRNQILNSPVQGTACDIVQDGYDRLSEMEIEELQANLQVHDDLSFLLPDADVEKYGEIIVGEMIKPVFDFINVPLIVDMSVGKNWGQLSEVGTFDSFKWWGLPKRPVV